ncbi:MAG: SDR family NAD(P)-dependent oxidoreductase [Gammaproteobacteria bacterium]|jgi:NAD(P)-dependent dehydrogenase (short-subunit alcohol dehydrogenase family)|nr:MAG: SDR family NAD(P)-dependent oxidoreductase [Gammaproteobacteria bacterium]
MDYRERHVVVTGGTGALGTAVVGALLEAGAVCHVPYRSEGEAKRFPHGDNKKVSLVALRDLADEAAVTDFYGGLDQLWASIHIAGGFAFAPIATSDKALLLSQLNANLVSAYLCSRAAVAAFERTGAGGRIVNVAARHALEPRLGASLTAYAVAKAGVAALTMALGEEIAKDDVLVNAVAPSIMDTPANRKSMPKADFDAWPKVEEVAAAIMFLASPENKVTRGAIVPVYGKF